MKRQQDGLITIFMVLWIVLTAACTHRADLIGKWQEVGKTATVEFFKDGIFKAVDNQGMAVKGRYVYDAGRLRLDIARPGLTPERVTGECSVKSGQLTLISEDGKEVEQYQHQN